MKGKRRQPSGKNWRKLRVAGLNAGITGSDAASRIGNIDGLGDARREQYSTLILLAAASGLRSSELLASKFNDIDFKASTVRVDESSDQRTNGNIALAKYCGLSDGCAA